MEVVATLPPRLPLGQVPDAVRRLEHLGFDTIHVPETIHDSLAVALLAVEHTSSIRVRTSMTLAFPRSPMVVAQAAWDLAQLSGGRFELGLATQVRKNIEERFSVAWDDPVSRLGDYLAAMRAIFAAFEHGEPLAHRGPHYTFTRLQPYFRPDTEARPPSLYMGAVNPAMCRLAGAAADGFVSHPTHAHPEYLRQHALPEIREGALAAGREGGPRIVVVTRCLTGPNERAVADAREDARRELAFLLSTPNYGRILALLDQSDVAARLRTLVRADEWDRLGDVLGDDLLDELAPTAPWSELPAVLSERYEGLVDGLGVPVPDDRSHDDQLAALVTAVREITAAGHDVAP